MKKSVLIGFMVMWSMGTALGTIEGKIYNESMTIDPDAVTEVLQRVAIMYELQGLNTISEVLQSADRNGQITQMIREQNMESHLQWQYAIEYQDVPLYSFYTSADLGGYGDNLPPYEPSNPNPGNGATSQPKDVTLGWQGGDPNAEDTLNYDVYFGSTNPPPLVNDHQSSTSYSTTNLAPNTQYYWKILARDNWEATTSGPVWSFQTRSNAAPYAPVNPIPTDAATNIDTNADLSWQCNDPDPGDTLTFDVYFGTSSNPQRVAQNISTMPYDPGTMTGSTVYYWKIIARDAWGSETTGPIWHFTTMAGGDNNPPYLASNPNPANGATGVYIQTDLSWVGGDPDAGDSVVYDVYLGNSSNPPLIAQSISSATYDPGSLSEFTAYYWKIVTRDSHQASTIGDVWMFTTGSSTDPTPTPSSNPCTAYGVVLDMGDEYFCPGETCYLNAEVCNPNQAEAFPLFVILDIEGSYWFADSWSQDMDYMLESFATGWTTKVVIPAFVWPEVEGSYSGIRIWGALTNLQITEIVGDYALYTFGYGPCR